MNYLEMICYENLVCVVSITECKEFEAIILDTLNRLKKRYTRGNNAPFMTKELCKAIMVRSRLRNKSLKLKTIESREARNLRNISTKI